MKPIVTTFLLLSVAVCQAQVSFGPRVGLNISRTNFSSDEFSTSYRPDFYAGGFVSYSVTEKFSLRGELFYSREGGKEVRLNDGASGKLMMSYVQLPVLARFHFNGNIFAEAGPQLGYLVSAKEEFDGEHLDIMEFYKRSDFRFPVGVGYEFTGWGLKGVGVEFRYSFSFSAINKEPVGGDDLKNRVFSVGATFRL
ncbi:MAG: porin family protein [Chitinophagaceae bacterium]